MNNNFDVNSVTEPVTPNFTVSAPSGNVGSHRKNFSDTEELHSAPDVPSFRRNFHDDNRFNPTEVSEKRSSADEEEFETELAQREDKDGSNPGFRPIVGWMVCTEGNDRGNAYPLYDGDNYIGRASSSKGASDHDIALNDMGISRQRTADVYYARKYRYFVFSRMPGVKVECELLTGDRPKPIINNEVELSRYEKVRIGKTTLMLVPLCCEEFDWDSEDYHTAGTED